MSPPGPISVNFHPNFTIFCPAGPLGGKFDNKFSLRNWKGITKQKELSPIEFIQGILKKLKINCKTKELAAIEVILEILKKLKSYCRIIRVLWFFFFFRRENRKNARSQRLFWIPNDFSERTKRNERSEGSWSLERGLWSPERRPGSPLGWPSGGRNSPSRKT